MDDNSGDPYAIFDGLFFSPQLEPQPDHTGTTTPSQDVQVSEPISPPTEPAVGDIQQEPTSASEPDIDLASFMDWWDSHTQADFGLHFPIDSHPMPPVSQDQINSVKADIGATQVPDPALSFIPDVPAADTLPEPQPPSVVQLPQPPIVPSQPVAAVTQELATPAPPVPAQQSLPPTLSFPLPKPPALKSVTAVQMMQANDRWNPKYSESGLRSWGALKQDMRKEIDRETETGEVVAQIPWDEAFRHLGKRQFQEYYRERRKMAKQHNLSLEELPGWIKSYIGCLDQSFSAPPAPAAVTHHAVAQKLLNRGNNQNKGKGKARMNPAPRPMPYARHRIVE